MLSQKLDQASIVRQNVYRPSFDLCQNTPMEIVDLVSQAGKLANTLTVCKVPAVPPNEAVEKLPRSCWSTRSAARGFRDGEIA